MQGNSFPKITHRARLILVSFIISLLYLNPVSVHAETVFNNPDTFLSGYISAILEQELGMTRDSYTVQTSNGNVIISLVPEAAQQQVLIIETVQKLKEISSLQVNIIDTQQVTDKDAPLGEFLTKLLGFSRTRLPFPYGDPFQPLMADPKQPKFFVSALRYHATAGSFTAGSVGYGETFGIYRRLGKQSNEGLQVSISGGLFALFNLDAPSHDLINADYTIGLPISYRKGDTSVRLRVYHQSSHLGDEFLLRAQPERVNLSFESLELLVSQDLNNYRGYIGGEVMLRREPKDLKRLSFHSGIEYRGTRKILDAGQFIAGIDLKSWEENDWYLSKSVRVGLEIGNPDPTQRKAALMLEFYEGYAPHGQFYDERIDYYGLGIHIKF